ncbi:hypothetical protein Tco_1213138 [Tanacetum coccineum]
MLMFMVSSQLLKKITETALIIHQSEKKNSEDIISGKKDSDSNANSSELSHSKASAKSLAAEVIHPKGKGVATEEPMKELIPYIEEGGSDPKILNVKSFVTQEGVLSQEYFMAQLKEMKRLVDLKEKRAKMLDEYNKCIYERADPFTITRIHYRASSSRDATMRITIDHDPLNVMVYKKFKLKTLGFSEWLEVQALESKTSSKSNDLLLQILGAMFNWIITQAKKLGIPPPPELAHIGKPTEDKKRKRTEILTKVFVKENIVVDEMKRNLDPPQGVEDRRGLFYLATTVHLVKLLGSIIRDTPEAEEVYKLIELEIESRNDVMRAREIVEKNLDGIGQHICIQVKDIIKEVEDYLKTYSSVGMDISWLSLSSSSGPSTPPSSYPGPSTHPTYSLGPSGSTLNLRKAECSNCKFLAEKIKTLEEKIKILEATVEMERHPENHTLESAAILHELYNDTGKLGLE